MTKSLLRMPPPVAPTDSEPLKGDCAGCCAGNLAVNPARFCEIIVSNSAPTGQPENLRTLIPPPRFALFLIERHSENYCRRNAIARPPVKQYRACWRAGIDECGLLTEHHGYCSSEHPVIRGSGSLPLLAADTERAGRELHHQ